MDTIPQTFMSDPVFRRLNNVAKYAALTDRDKKAYKESLKVYRDNYAIAETERNEGRAEALAEKARQAKEMGLPDDVIARLFGSLN